MIYNSMFKELEAIIKNDYSGLKDKAVIIEAMDFNIEIDSREQLTTKSQALLRRLKDHHFKLLDRSIASFSNGFSTRRYKDTLIVSEVFNDHELNVGDVITHLDGPSVVDAQKKYHDYFYSSDKSRQEWRDILKLTYLVEVVGKGEVVLQQFPSQNSVPHYAYEVVNDIPVLTFGDFNDEAAILEVIKSYEAEADKYDYLVVDVRNNAGGSDLSYFPLLKFLFAEEKMLSELSSDTMATLYSKRNCDVRIEMFLEVLDSEPNLPNEVRVYLEQEIEKYKVYYDKGFITVDDDFDYLIEGRRTPKHVFILTDQYCGSSGDSFVRVAQMSSKVTCLGRATMGVLDYSNVAFYDLGDDLEVMYPTSRMNFLDTMAGIDNIGIAPDIFIPWTPNHLVSDVDFAAVLQIIHES